MFEHTVYIFRAGKLFGSAFSCSFNAIVDALKSTEKAHNFCDKIRVSEYRNNKAIVTALNGEPIGFIEIQTF